MRTDPLNTPLEVIILVQEKISPKKVSCDCSRFVLSFQISQIAFSSPLERTS